MASTDTRANQLVRDLIAHHAIKHDTLALLADRTRSYITRIVNGSHPPTADVMRALYKLTGDPDIISYLTGEAGLVTVNTRDAADDPLPDVMDVVSGMTRADTSPAQRHRTDRAIAALAAYRLRLTAPPAAPSAHRLDATA